MAKEKVIRRLAAILAADVAGYSRLVEYDEVGTIARLRAIRQDLIDPSVARFHGRVVKTMGDGLLIEYPSVVDAVLSAVEVQREMAERNAGVPEERRLEFRVGINLGDIVIDGDDILGDGVNVAARLEALADPGGICLSGAAHEQVDGKIDLAFEHLGAHTVKNIRRPIDVCRVKLEEVIAMAHATTPSEISVPDPPAGPSIAVLPFDNMSGDPEDEYFADGITEDIITELSRFPTLFVIARNSSFTYKGRAVRVQAIGNELGVRYVAEGSVRKSGDRVRVSVQLIDSETGNHVWAERYDRKLVDIFEVQDELTRAIVAALPGRVGAAEEKRLKRKPPQDMAAYDYLIAGKIHHHRVTAEDNAEALRLLQKAIELDPDYAEAYAWKACTLGQALQCGFDSDSEKLLNEAIASVTRALSLDENNVECQRLLCEVHMERHDLDQAAVHGARAIAANPNDPRLVAQQGELMTWMGRAEEGVEWLQRAMRLDPHGMVGRVHLLGRALYGVRRYADAVDAYRQKTAPRYTDHAGAAACYGQLGVRDEAEKQTAAVLQQKPDFSIGSHVASLPYAQESDRNHYADGLRKAGLPA